MGLHGNCHALLFIRHLQGHVHFCTRPRFFVHKRLSEFPLVKVRFQVSAHSRGTALTMKKSFPAVSGKGLLMVYDVLEIGSRIQKLRREKGLTQEKLAEQLNISTVHLAKTEAGKRSCSLDVLSNVAVFLDTSLDYLVFGKVSDHDVRVRLDSVIQILEELRKDM